MLNFVSTRYLVQNFDWLEEKLGDVDDDYILFDCPGILLLLKFSSSVTRRFVFDQSVYWSAQMHGRHCQTDTVHRCWIYFSNYHSGQDQ